MVGRIVAGDSEVGRLVEVIDDAENTGGFLIVTRSDAGSPTQTFDSWVESIVDVDLFFNEAGWQVEWRDGSV